MIEAVGGSSYLQETTKADAFPSISGEAFNIGGNEEYSVAEIVQILQELTGKNIDPERLPAPPGDVRRRVGSSKAAQAQLGYNPSISLREGQAAR